MDTTTIETTSISTATLPQSFPLHRLTIDRYNRMVETDIFSAKEPIFLWHGRLVEKITKGISYSYASAGLQSILHKLVPSGWHVRGSAPVGLGVDSMSEPDLSVVRGRARDYLQRHPMSQDVAMIVEVADSSLAVDSGDVLQTYAKEGVPVYWLVNIPKRRVEVYAEPLSAEESPCYGQCRHFGPGEAISVVLDGRELNRVAVDEFLP